MVFAAMALALTVSLAPCSGKGTAVYVDATERRLWLCKSGAPVMSMPVALGRGGLDKRWEGDGKVPLGAYPLGAPRASKAFHLFIPVGFPTPIQRRQGFNGGAIGIHGPSRAHSGPLSTGMDWTLGCIAVGTDDEIDRVARWVKESKARRIIIEERELLATAP
jgi:murein L,D-transpeptidase YafK